jgi:ABC-type transporter Mla subunit MlaD
MYLSWHCQYVLVTGQLADKDSAISGLASKLASTSATGAAEQDALQSALAEKEKALKEVAKMLDERVSRTAQFQNMQTMMKGKNAEVKRLRDLLKANGIDSQAGAGGD